MVILLTFVCFQLSAQKRVVWNTPVYKNNPRMQGPWGDLISVKKVSMTSEETVVTFHIDMMKKTDMDFAPTTCLMADGIVYPVIKWKGVKKKGRYVIHVPENGKADFSFSFRPLPLNTRKFDFTENDNAGGLFIRNICKEFVYNGELFPSNWRNTKTGEWIIGFRKDGAVYDCQVWNYKLKKERRNAWHIVLTNGMRDVKVKIGKSVGNGRRMQIDKAKPMDCDPIVNKVLPDYPFGDNRTFADNNYRQGDSVTIRGWLVNMSERMKQNKEFSVGYTNVFTGKENKIYTHIDSLGQFSLTFPVLNTQEVFIDWGRAWVLTVVEPGETYFLFCDFDSGQKIFMGSNSRFQNELLAYPMMEASPVSFRNGSVVDFGVFAQKGIDFLNHQNAALDSLVNIHPCLSCRYQTYQKGYWKMDIASNLGQSRFKAKGNILPLKIFNLLRNNFWNQLPHPCTLYAQNFNFFVRDFTEDMLQRSGMLPKIKYTDVLKQGFIKMTFDNSRMIQHYSDDEKELMKEVKGLGVEKRKVLVNKFSRDHLKEITFLRSVFEKKENRRLVDSLLLLQSIKMEENLCDSLDADITMKNILLSRFFYSMIDTRRHSFNSQTLKEIKNVVVMPQARELLLGENNKYLVFENQSFSHAESLKSSDVVKGMTDGEKILRKIIEPFKNKIVLVDVWGSWCGPCKEALSHSREEYKVLDPYDVVFLYLADNSPEESCKNIIREYGVAGQNVVHYNLPSGQQQAVENFLGVTHYPSYRLIDREGQVLSVNADPRDLPGLVRLLDDMK